MSRVMAARERLQRKLKKKEEVISEDVEKLLTEWT